MDGPKSIPPDSRPEALSSSEKPVSPLESKVTSLTSPIFQSQERREPPKLSLQIPLANPDADDLDSPVEVPSTRQSPVGNFSEGLTVAEKRSETIFTLYATEGRVLDPEFLNDPDVMLIAIDLNPHSFKYASDELKSDLDFLTRAGCLSPEIVKQLHENPEIKKQKQEELLQYIQENGWDGPGIETLKNTLLNALN